jgi:hypothetical protein
MTDSSRSHARNAPPLLVLDEFPYLVQETPGLPSIVQSLYDSLGPVGGAGTDPFRLLLRGSAISVMADLLSGTKALRGRAALELRVRPFSYRNARDYWGIADPAAAFAHNALVGGTRPSRADHHRLPRTPRGPRDRRLGACARQPPAYPRYAGGLPWRGQAPRPPSRAGRTAQTPTPPRPADPQQGTTHPTP